MSLRRFFNRLRQDRDRDEEMRQHLQLAIDHYIRQGMTPDDARRTAAIRFGNARTYRERVDDMNRLPLVDVFSRDLGYAVRRLRRAPAFSATVIVTLAVVIGATSAVFSLADAILLSPLPFPSPDRLAIVSYKRVTPTGEYIGPSVDGAMWAAIRDHAPQLDAAIANRGTQGVNFVLNNTPSFVQNQQVGAGFFRVLGVSPLVGREFSNDEARAGGPPVAVLSFEFWQRVFQGRPDAIGQSILLRGEPYTVVGVMPGGFSSVFDADVWTPQRGAGQGLNYMVIARARDHSSFAEATARLAGLGTEPFTMLRPPASSVTRSLTLQELQDTLVADAREPIVMLGWSVATVLLIACVNIAVLLIARSSGRAKEIATRMALGSGRSAVIRQLMMESAVMAVLGGVAGIAIAYAGLEGLKAVGGTTFADWERVTLNGRTIAATMGLSVMTSVIFGLLPAWQTSRIDVHGALTDGGSRSIAGGARQGLRRLLVIVEVAMGVVMLVGAGLLLREFASLSSLDPGFSPERLYSVSASLQDARYKDPAVVNQLFARSLARLENTPGIDAAAVSQGLPYQRLLNLGFRLEGKPDDDRQPAIANVAYVTPGFFQTFGIALRDGRPIELRDAAASLKVAVVNEMFADIYFRNEPVVGRRILFGTLPVEIVGVCGDVQQAGSGFSLSRMRRGPVAVAPAIYLPAQQAEPGMFAWFNPVWTVRAASIGAASQALSQAIGAVDPLLPLENVRSMTTVTARALARPRLMMSLVGVLALAAVLLSAIGIHGLITHVVSSRTREFGIRIALGASQSQIVRAVALPGIALAMTGAALGVALSFPASKVVESFLANVTTRDVPTYAAVAVLVALLAAVSSVLPALKIVRLDPAKTLRQ